MSCFSCFSSKVSPDEPAAVEPDNQEPTIEEACVVELESLFSAGDRRTIRFLFNWLSARRVGDPLRQIPSARETPVAGLSRRASARPSADPNDLARKPPATIGSGKEKTGVVVLKDVLDDYLKLPSAIFDQVWSAFRGSHASHFHTTPPNHLLGTNEVDYHFFLHALATFVLPEEGEQLLFQMLDAFSHSSSHAQESGASKSTSPSRKSSIMGTLRRNKQSSLSSLSLNVVPNLGGDSTPQVILMKELARRRVFDNEIGKGLTLGRKKKKETIQMRMKSIKAGSFVVVLSEKIVPEKPGDEAFTISHGELCRILTAVATMRMCKFGLVNRAYGKVPTSPHMTSSVGTSAPSWLLTPNYTGPAQTSVASGSASGDQDPVASQIAYIRQAVTGIADQVFRFVRYSPGLDVRAPAEFSSSETITLSQLRQWVSLQAPTLAEGFATFLQDNFMTLFAVPEYDILHKSGGDQFDPRASMTRIARLSRNMCSEQILPVLTSMDARPTAVTPFVAWQLSTFIPETAAKKSLKYVTTVQANWKLIYSGNHHGFSLQMFRDHVFKANTATVVLINGQPKSGKVTGTPTSERITIGAYVPTGWEEVKNGYFGNEEAFIFELHPYFEILNTTMQNNMYAHFGPSGVTFGGGATAEKQKEARIILDETMQSGTYQQHPVQVSVAPTYRFSRTRNIVTSTGHRTEDFIVPFDVIDLEVYAIGAMDPGAAKEEPSHARRRSSMRMPAFDTEPTTDADYLQFMKEMEDTLAGTGEH